MTQLGWRPIRKCWKWVEPSEVEVRLWKDMGNQGANHDICDFSSATGESVSMVLEVKTALKDEHSEFVRI